MNENDKQAEPVALDHTDLIKRIDAAIERVTQGRGLMSIPADPRSDVDLVLSECKALLQGENPPFWATDFHPAQPVQPAVNEQDRLDAARYRWLFGARTEDECQNWKVGHLPLKPQDRVIGQVATVFMPKVAVDGEIDAAMAAEAEAAKGGV